MMPLIRAALLACALAPAGAVSAAGTDLEPQPFVRGSQQAIVAAHVGMPFMLALWSLDCTYCRHDLAMLGRLQQDHPQLRLVMVATDPPARRGEIAPALAELGVEGESWLFADAYAERLRYEVDAEWLGELPRTYFYDDRGERIGISGSLDEEAVREWIVGAYGEAAPTVTP
ncbi:MAG: TlpA family protein disulfide reductase [Gammaproteobacteria bacterium]|jgi:thiol-disulfide isomerase/thioredoxin|nr:TlpA family protein disulfide reductase [Gammaproteobacteria bacterium]